MSRPLQGVVTGASGFIGRYLVRELVDAGWCVAAVALSDRATRPLDVEAALLAGIREGGSAAANVVVFHLAGVTDGRDDELEETNCSLALEAYEAAKRAGVGCFVYLSSSHVFGATTGMVDESAKVAPDDNYGRSKALAEMRLAAAASPTTRVVIVRAPPVYGAGCRGNLIRLLRLVERRWPIPLAAAGGRRSYISAFNLASALRWLGSYPGRDGENDDLPASIWHVADSERSAADWCEAFAVGLDTPLRLFGLPHTLLAFLVTVVLGARGARALLEPFHLDTRRLQSTGWIPPQAVEAGTRDMVKWFRSQSRH